MRRSHGTVRAGYGLCFALALLVGPVSNALGQVGRLPTQIVTSATINAEQQAKIDEYVEYWMTQLVKGETPEAVAEARNKLLEPLRNQLTSDAARAAIQASIADRLPKPGAVDSLIVRMNLLIVCAELRNGKVAELAIGGLTDKSPAIRYWAAKVVAQVNRQADPANPVLSNADQQTILDKLKQTAPAERSDVVLLQQFDALANLTIAGSTDALLKILRDRVKVHQKAINEGLRADQQALASLQSKLVYEAAVNQNVKPTLTELTVVGAHYLQVVAHALAGGKLDKNLEPVARNTAESVEKIFSLALDQFDREWPAEKRKPLSGPTLDKGILLLNTLDWVGTPQKPGVLTTSKIAIPFKDLQLPGAAAAPEPPDPAGGAPK